MVSAWYMDDDEVTDQRLEHHRDPPMFIETDKLFRVSGVEYYQVDPDRYKSDEGFEKLLKSRGITYEDEIVVSEDRMENYAQKLKIFYEEHLHTDEEIRYVLEGSGYFDVRDNADEWIRIKVVPGDLIILPSGIYHRFTLDDKNCIKAKRYFAGEPVWKPYNRPADNMECRLEYIERSNQGFVQN